MKELKITIDQLKNYLGTGLKIGHPWGAPKTWELHHDTDVDFDNRCSLNYVVLQQAKPIVYRLSDLDKEIEHNGERFVPLDMLNKSSTALTLYRMETENKTFLVFDTAVHGYNLLASFNRVQQLFEWHFWPFGDEYFEQGLVLDKMKHNNE